jgi:hypothetical protein
MRFNKKSISQGEYQFAVDKIKEPYPPYIADTVNMVQKSAEEVLKYQGTGPLFFDYLDKGEREESTRISTNTLAWMEDQKAETGKYPEPDKIYEAVRKFGVQVETPSNLPPVPVTIKPAPPKNEPTYVVTDADFEAIPVGTEFYSAILGEWVIKEKE